MQPLLSDMPIAPGAGAMHGIRTTPCRRPALIAIVLICGMVSPAFASVEAPAAADPKRPESLRTTWMIAQAPRVDPNTIGGAPFAPPPAVPQYRVAGVASSDVLNIRSGPDAGSAIVGTIPPYGSGIRMTGSCAGQWCPIDYQGSQGWVNRRYLTNE